MRRAKIVCTLGPASNTPEMVDALIDAGMDCARLNFSHGDHETHARTAELVREAAAKRRRPVAVLADLCGPKMRVGRFADGPVQLEEGARFVLTTEDVPGDAERVSHSYEPLSRDVVPGDAILLDDGLLRLKVVETTETDVITEVEVGGQLSDRKGLNVPGANLSTPALTEKDRVDLAFAVDELGVDYLALSFVRTADDVRQAQALAKGTPVIAKLEKPEAIENLEHICNIAEGAMVARGDLGVEVGSEKVPLIQKRIIREVNARGKLVITATQMLDSMMRNPRPTRAEAADVANAVIDGSDAVMLSGETAAGKYPIASVRMMDAIIREVESEWIADQERGIQVPGLVDREEWGFTDAAARAAAMLSYALPLEAIVTFTRDGRTARLLSEYRPRSMIIAITARREVANRMALEWGVMPRTEIPPDTLEEALRLAGAMLVREEICAHGQSVAIVMGWPPSVGTNTVKLHTL
ncbi:MAG TPA: pyruvate kinase [Sandaracinaceae bacterium LLY-WYZ-13_1]|nr:pyruvate kinase [Sandaracinaceae bacterium LLY-WYZ-13_1]